MERISVIVPVYKVEEYLDRCVQSIVDQTYKNLEIILVDDGSPDNCPAMCDAWAQKDTRIKVIHKKNGGLSDARNAGMEVSTGDYIAFVDSDDWVHRDYIIFLYRAIQEHDAELAACNVKVVYEEGSQSTEQVQYKAFPANAEQALETLIHGTGFRAVAWNKLYSRELLKQECFKVGRLHEDEFFTYRILAKAKRLAFVESPLYYYLQRSGSIMRTVSIRHLDALDARLLRLKLLEKQFPRLYREDKAGFCVACVAFYREFLRFSGSDKAQALQKIKKCRCEVHFTHQEMLGYTAKQKLYIVLSRFVIGIFSMLLNMRGTGKNE